MYLAKRKRPRTPPAIAGHDTILCTALTPTPEWRFFRGEEETRVTIASRFVTNSADAALGHAMLGGGLTLVLAYQAAEAVRSGALKVLLPEHEPPLLPIHVVYPTSRLLSAKFRAFVDLVTTTCDWRFTSL